METSAPYAAKTSATAVVKTAKEYITENLGQLSLSGFIGKTSSIKLVQPEGKKAFVTFDFCATVPKTEQNPEGKQWYTVTTEHHDLLVVLFEGRKLELSGVANKKTEVNSDKAFYNMRSYKVTFC